MTGRRTHHGGLLAKVLLLVAAEEALGLDGRGRAPGELLVKVDDTLHAQGIGSRSNSLKVKSSVLSLARFLLHPVYPLHQQ